MRTKSVLLWTCLLSLCWLGRERLVYGEDGDPAESDAATDNKRKLSPFEEGLIPFYKMTNMFLGIVQNKDLLTVQPEVFNALFPQIDSAENLDTQDQMAIITENWKSLAYYGIGYVVCIAIGIVYIVLMPLIGLCFCCCRLCGNCGGKVKPRKGRHHKCRQFTCGVLLAVFATIMLVSVILAFMTNEEIRLRLSPKPEGMIPKARGYLSSFITFTNSLRTGITSTFDTDVEIKFDEILAGLDDLPNAAIRSMDKLTNTTAILDSARILVDSVTNMKPLINTVESKTTELINLQSPLSTKLMNSRTAISNIIGGCSAQMCTSLNTDIMALSVVVDFSSLNVSPQKDSLDDLGDITQIIPDRISSYNNIKDEVRTTIGNTINEVRDQKQNVLDDIREVVGSISKDLKNVSEPFRVLDNQLQDLQQPVKKYSTYYWYAAIGLTCVFLLIVLCFYLGILFGVCGEPPYEDSKMCNKGVGANLLLAAVGFCFLFGWLLMLVCMLLFIPGAVIHGEVCRHLSPDLTISSYVKYIDEQTYPYLKTFNFTHNISNILSRCKNNEGIYSALGLQNLFDLNVLNIENYNFQDQIDQLKNNNINLGNIVIIDDSLTSNLEKLGNSSLDNIAFTEFFTELDKAPLSTVVTMLLTKLNNVKSALTSTQATEMEVEITKLSMIKNMDIKTFEEKQGELRLALDNLQNLINGQTGAITLSQKVERLTASLKTAQKNLNDGTGLNQINMLFNDTATQTYQKLINFTIDTKASIRNDIGKCRPLYTILSGGINVICVDFLYPYNGFWFSFGVCLAFFIPAIIAGVHLAGSYRKTEEYDASDTKSFDDPNFDAYSGGMFPGDNIPLEERRNYKPLAGQGYDRRKDRSNARGRGLPNAAYERDARPSNHAAPAPIAYRDNYNRDNYARNGGPPAYNDRGGYGRHGGDGGGYPAATPSNPPHYYNNRNILH